MLKFSTHQAFTKAVPVSQEEDQTLRLAFGRFGHASHRKAGEKVVFRYYAKNHCFHCDCRPLEAQAPLIFLVEGTHIRRQTEGKGTPHHDNCDFAYDEERLKSIGFNYRLPTAEDRKKLNLLGNFGEAEAREPRNPSPVSQSHGRTKLARVLCMLLHEAQLDRLGPAEPLHGKKDQQVAAIKDVAETFSFDAKHPLTPWLAMSLFEYDALHGRLSLSLAKWKRPQGLFIGVFDRIEDKTLYPTRADKKPITVTGTLSVFAEGEDLRRPPYMVIGLVGQPSRDATTFEMLQAYAHPCVFWDRYLLVDSQLERETLEILVSCRNWLAKQHGVSMTIEKPLFDVGPTDNETPREVCLPDFILHCQGNAGHSCIVIETMGMNGPVYRDRKRRLKGVFQSIGPGHLPVPVIEHDRFQEKMDKAEIDKRFFSRVCAAILNKDFRA